MAQAIVAMAYVFFLAVAPTTRAEETIRKYSNDDCLARIADKPSLRRDLLPSAQFRKMETLESSDIDDTGRRVETYFKFAEETARLPNGVRLKVELSGCEKYIMTYEFRIPRTHRRLSDQSYWISKSERLMAVVGKVTKDQPIAWKRLGRDLLRAARTGKPGATPATKTFEWEMEQGGEHGVGVTTYQINAEHKPDADIITFVYSVSL